MRSRGGENFRRDNVAVYFEMQLDRIYDHKPGPCLVTGCNQHSTTRGGRRSPLVIQGLWSYEASDINQPNSLPQLVRHSRLADRLLTQTLPGGPATRTTLSFLYMNFNSISDSSHTTGFFVCVTPASFVYGYVKKRISLHFVRPQE